MTARLDAYRTAILAYESDYEAFRFTDHMPFSMTRGTVIGLNGVRAVDPDAVVTIGFGFA